MACKTLLWATALGLPASLFFGKRFLSQDLFKGQTEFKASQTTSQGTKLSAKIWNDKNGFKYIEGETFLDGMFGQGFAQCRDRLWQMNFLRSLSQGKLGELIGPDGLDVDIFLRMWGLKQAAEHHAKKLTPEDMEVLEAYQIGINTCAENIKVWPFEFYMVWTDFKPWTFQDTISIHLLMAVFLSFDFPLEIMRHKLSEVYDWETMLQMYPFKPEDGLFGEQATVITDEMLKESGFYYENANLFDIDEDLLAIPKKENGEKYTAEELKDAFIGKEARTQFPPSSQMGQEGSNCWAVHGDHTKSGKPILVCDPHLMKMTSPKWHFTYVKWNDNYQVGAAVPGMFINTYSRGKYNSWGCTALNEDVMDVFVEKVNDDESQFFYEGQWVDFTEKTETFYVRGKGEVKHTYKHTKQGVIMEPLKGEAAKLSVWVDAQLTFPKAGSNERYSVKWAYSALDFPQQPAQYKKAVYAPTAKEFFKHIQQNQIGPINFIVATTNGDIGFLPGVLYPKRKYGIMQGIFPKKGWLSDNEWQGSIDTEEIAFDVNPKRGYIVSTNNRATSSNVKHPISFAFNTPHRAIRIGELIEELIQKNKKIDFEDMKRIQMDVLDVQSRESCPLLLKYVEKVKAESYNRFTEHNSNKELIEHSIKLLDQWDYEYTLESVPAAIFSMWETRMKTNMQSYKIRDDVIRLNAATPTTYDAFLFREIKNWQDPTKTSQQFCRMVQWANIDQTDNCLFVASLSLFEAVSELKKKFGADINTWQLGELQIETLEHQPFGGIPVIGNLFNMIRKGKGNRRTTHMAFFAYQANHFDARFGSVIRLYSDWADFDPENPDMALVKAAIDCNNEGHFFGERFGQWLDLYPKGVYDDFAFSMKEELVADIS